MPTGHQSLQIICYEISMTFIHHSHCESFNNGLHYNVSYEKINTQTQSVGVCAAPLLECIGNNFIAKIQVHSTSSIYKWVPKWKTLEMPFHLREIHLSLATTRIQRLLTVQTLISKDSTIQQKIIFFLSI